MTTKKLDFWIGWLFLVPVIVLNLAVVLGPGVASLYYSLTEWSGLGAAKFIGIKNFQDMIGDPDFKLAFINNVKWMVMNLTLPVGFGLVGASLLSAVKKFSIVYRVTFFLPYVIASVVNVNIWLGIYHPTKGVGAFLANAFNLPFLNLVPLGDPNLVLYAVFFTNFWHWWGFLLVLYLAAMQAVSIDLYEAAIVEGANRTKQFIHVTIPGIRPTLIYSILQTIIWSFTSFDYIYLMTRGGPGRASILLAVLSFEQAFEVFRVGYATAIGLTLSFVAGVVTILFFIIRKRGWEI